MIMNNTKIYWKMKNKSLMSIKKKLYNEKKRLIIIIRKYYFKVRFSPSKQNLLYLFQ